MKGIIITNSDQRSNVYILITDVTNILISLLIKKPLYVWKLASTKREDYKKLLHKKAWPYRCGCAHHLHYSTMKRNAHVWQMFGVLFSNVLLQFLRPRVLQPSCHLSTPLTQSLTPFFCRCRRYFICFWPALVLSIFTCCFVFKLKINYFRLTVF